jgi:Putative DNA-binding domain
MTLAELQRDFRSWLVTASADAASRLGAGATAGLSVYQNNYRAQLVGCLEESFPLVRAWIGDEAFLGAAIAHIDSHPPHAWTLDAYADDFNETLTARFPNNPDVQELAWIEHALSKAFIAPDAEPLPLDALAAIDWDSARLLLAPSFMSHAATTNAESVWSALWEEKEPPEGEILAEPGALIVWRRGFTSRLKQVDALEHEALVQLQQDGSFAALCDLLVERLGEADGVAKAGALLADWLGSELITGVDAA